MKSYHPVITGYQSLLYDRHSAESLARLASTFARCGAFRLAEESIACMTAYDYPRAVAAMLKLVEMIGD